MSFETNFLRMSYFAQRIHFLHVNVEFEAYNQNNHSTRMCATIIGDSLHISQLCKKLYIAFHYYNH